MIPYKNEVDLVVKRLRDAKTGRMLTQGKLTARIERQDNGEIAVGPFDVEYTGEPGYYRGRFDSSPLLMDVPYRIIVETDGSILPKARWVLGDYVEERPFAKD